MARQAAQQQRGLVADLGVLGAPDDRRKHAVDVAEHGRARRLRGQRRERLPQRFRCVSGHRP
jgi:hypothetical protein